MKIQHTVSVLLLALGAAAVAAPADAQSTAQADFVGSDGNWFEAHNQDGAVSLSAEATPPATCVLLPAVQQVREAARR